MGDCGLLAAERPVKSGVPGVLHVPCVALPKQGRAGAASGPTSGAVGQVGLQVRAAALVDDLRGEARRGMGRRGEDQPPGPPLAAPSC